MTLGQIGSVDAPKEATDDIDDDRITQALATSKEPIGRTAEHLTAHVYLQESDVSYLKGDYVMDDSRRGRSLTRYAEA